MSAPGLSRIEGQLIAEVQMDKVDAEVLASVAGTVTLLVAEGAEMVQGGKLLRSGSA